MSKNFNNKKGDSKMIGIYNDNFKTYLEEKLGSIKEITKKNIICSCPFCESENDDELMYISTEVPAFKCFNKNCNETGTLRKLTIKLHGHDIADTFVVEDELEKQKNKKNNGLDMSEFLKFNPTKEEIEYVKKNYKIKETI